LFDIATRAKTAGDAIKDFFNDLAKRLLQMAAERLVERAFGSFGTNQTGAAGGLIGAFMSAFAANANGNAFQGGQVMAFANGGVVGGPTLFPMQSRIGLMGEAGPEAIMPLKRGSDGKLGVVADVSRARGDTNINVTVPVQGSVDYRTRLQVGQATGRVVRNATRNS